MVAAAILLIGFGGWMLLGSPGSGDRNDAAAEAVGADARAVDLASMTPLEAADRLYVRIMERMARGDTAQARAFLPMASAAYDRVPAEERDPLVRYRVGVLHQLEGRPEASSAQADTILASYPSHLLGLFMAGESAQMLGDGDAATRHYARFLEVFPSEIDDPRPEYRTHVDGLTAMRQHAESYLARGAR